MRARRTRFARGPNDPRRGCAFSRATVIAGNSSDDLQRVERPSRRTGGIQPCYIERKMTMKKISLEKKKTCLSLALTLLVGGMLTLVMTQVAQAQKYSDWSAAVNLGPAINSAFSDQGPAISKDGLSLYFTSDRPEGLGGPFDMYVSQRASVDDPWGSPVNLGPTVNTAFDEGEPGLSRDGHFLFFQSKRPGGFGGIDLWVSYREHTHDDFDWQPAVNLGAGVNSAADDQGPSYFENEEDGAPQLYFGSSRPGGLGGADIYVSEQMADG